LAELARLLLVRRAQGEFDVVDLELLADVDDVDHVFQGCVRRRR
jgi:hypothetical protein